MLKIFFKFFIILSFLGGGYFYWQHFNKVNAQPVNNAVLNQVATGTPKQEIPKDFIEKIEITDKSTYGELMKTASITPALANEIYNASKDVYDLAKIRVGRFIWLVFSPDKQNLKELRYKVDSEDELFVVLKDGEWQAELRPIDYEVKIKTVGGEIESSLYNSAIKNNIDIRAIIELANAFQWTLDFAMDPRMGDTYKFVYEERYLDGKYVMPGKILAGKYVNAGNEYYIFYFEDGEDNKGYFDENGNSVQKMFLKAPVEFKYISSGYTTGVRRVMEIGLVGPHRAIDYAAPIGTPIRAVGDGVVTFTGWVRGYGNLTKIRHNGTYSTNYAHQSKILVKRGQRVKQGQIIGKVGSTGWSTGPHLHYEMVKNGVKINPLKEILPPGKPIKEENREEFNNEMNKYMQMLK